MKTFTRYLCYLCLFVLFISSSCKYSSGKCNQLLVGKWKPINVFFLDTLKGKVNKVHLESFSKVKGYTFIDNEEIKTRYIYKENGEGVNIYTFTTDNAFNEIPIKDSTNYLKIKFKWQIINDTILKVVKNNSEVYKNEIIKITDDYLILLEENLNLKVWVREDKSIDKIVFFENEYYILPVVYDIIKKKRLNILIINE